MSFNLLGRIVAAFHSDNLSSSFDLLIQDTKKLASDFIDISFTFVKRSANRVAHELARGALFKSGCEDRIPVLFPCISHVLDLDLA